MSLIIKIICHDRIINKMFKIFFICYNIFLPNRFIVNKMGIKFIVIRMLWKTSFYFEKPVPSSFIFVRY